MKKLTTLIALAMALAIGSAMAQEKKDPPKPPTITISANTMDVRSVINSIFAQANKSYVLENGVLGALNLALRDVEFDEALQIICKLSNLRFEEQNGIFFLSKVPPVKAATQPKVEQPPAKAAEHAKPKGQLPASTLAKRITTRFEKVDIRAIFADLTKQTGVEFEITAKVPAYRLDAYLIDTSLKFALETIAHAAGLEYKLTDNQTILITKLEPTKTKTVTEGNKATGTSTGTNQ